jgi:hypothetical protein
MTMTVTAEQMTEALATGLAQPWNRSLGGDPLNVVFFLGQWHVPDAEGNFEPASAELASVLTQGVRELAEADRVVAEVDERYRWHVAGELP